MADWFRYILSESEIRAARIVLEGERRREALDIFRSYLGVEQNTILNGVHTGRTMFSKVDDKLVIEVSRDIFRNLLPETILEASPVDGTTIEINTFPPIQDALEALKIGVTAQKVDAIRRLGDARDPGAMGALIEATYARDADVRVSAFRALGRFPQTDELLAHFVRAMKDRHPNVRNRTCDILSRYTHPRAVAILKKAAAHDRDLTVRWAARLALYTLKIPGFELPRLEFQN